MRPDRAEKRGRALLARSAQRPPFFHRDALAARTASAYAKRDPVPVGGVGMSAGRDAKGPNWARVGLPFSSMMRTYRGDDDSLRSSTRRARYDILTRVISARSRFAAALRSRDRLQHLSGIEPATRALGSRTGLPAKIDCRAAPDRRRDAAARLLGGRHASGGPLLWGAAGAARHAGRARPPARRGRRDHVGLWRQLHVGLLRAARRRDLRGLRAAHAPQGFAGRADPQRTQSDQLVPADRNLLRSQRARG